MIKRMAVSFGVVMALAGCGQSHNESASTPSIADKLIGHEFVLQELDGQAWNQQEGSPVMLRFQRDGEDQSLRVAGKLCNNFNGAGQLEGDSLTVKGTAMTRMLCANDTLNALDQSVSQMLEKGVRLSLDNTTLTFSGDAHTLVYRQQD